MDLSLYYNTLDDLPGRLIWRPKLKAQPSTHPCAASNDSLTSARGKWFQHEAFGVRRTQYFWIQISNFWLHLYEAMGKCCNEIHLRNLLKINILKIKKNGLFAHKFWYSNDEG